MLNSFRWTLLAAAVVTVWYVAKPGEEEARSARETRAAVASSYSTCTAQGTLALTVSDAPTSAYINSLVSAIAQTNVPVTYFVSTTNIRGNNNLRATFVNLVNTNKLALGLTYPQQTASQSYAQIQATLKEEVDYMFSVFGTYPLAVRFLAGSDSTTAIKAAADMGVYTVQYGVDTLLTTDEANNATTSVNAHLKLAFDGASPSKGSFIVMHHDATPYAIQVVPTMVAYGQNALYTWVSLATCLGVESLATTVAPVSATNTTTTGTSGSLHPEVFPAKWSFAVFFIALMFLGSF